MAGEAASAVAIFLHLIHLILAILIIIGLHFTGQIYDLKYTLNQRKLYNDYFERMSCDVEPIENLRLQKEKAETPYPNIYWTGALWAIVAGLLSLAALIVLFVGCSMTLPSPIQSYYLVAAILILLFASLGLGLNAGVEEYQSCLRITDKEESDWKDRHKGYTHEDWDKFKDYRNPTTCFTSYNGVSPFKELKVYEYQRQGSLFGGGNPVAVALSQMQMNPFSSPTARFPIFLISVLLALAYISSFLLKFFEEDETSSSMRSPGWTLSNQGQGQGQGGQNRDRAMREQQVRENQIREQEAKGKEQISGQQNPIPAKDEQAV